MTAINTEAFERDLRNRVHGEISFDEVTRGIYSTDASIYRIQPVAVVAPRDESDVRLAVQTAIEHGVSILPRGGGTSLAGQAVGASMVLDFSRHMNRILQINVQERWARVQPGVVRDELNAVLAKDGLHFAPDPATSDRSNFGGMIANNSSGTRSIIYGKTVDHVLETRVLLTDGEVLDLRALDAEEYALRARASTREGAILRQMREIIEDNREEIEKRYPKIMRRVMGYNLDELTRSSQWNLAKLITGSEGTLATILDAKVNLEPLPGASSICIVHFQDLMEAIRAVVSILPHGPSAVEIMDGSVLRMAREQLSIAPLIDFLEGEPAAILMVEFYGDVQDQAKEKCDALVADLKGRGMGYAYPMRHDAAGKARVLSVRKNGLGLMLGMKGDRRPIPFIEDAAVPVEVLAEYVGKVLDFCRSLEVPVSLYAHASVGLIHIRPRLDLRNRQDIDLMKRISRQAFEFVRSYGGSWSGEHGDGLVRSPYMEDFYGPAIYAAFKEVKKLFDPAGLMNPGKILDAGPMDQNLRYGPDYHAARLPTFYHYRNEGSFAEAVELCTGVGACRKTLSGLMCPSYMATHDEEHSTRGRANALRLAMTGQFGPDGMTGRRLYEVLDLCLSCKGCKSECPSNVDIARLKGEFLQHYHDSHGMDLRERMIATSADIAPIFAGWLAPMVNWFQDTALFRKPLELMTGFDQRRRLPHYTSRPFHKTFAKRQPKHNANSRRIVLFDDTYMNYYEPDIGISAVNLLEACGYRVTLARAGCCQRPRISHGHLREARKEGERTLRALDAYIREGLDIVVCEPSCASALTDDLPDLIDDEALGNRIRQHVHLIDAFLDREIKAGHIQPRFTSRASRFIVHGHCHQKALYGTAPMISLLRRVEGAEVNELDSGCCGMAGSFGYEKEHYDLSMKIAERRLLPAIRNRTPGTEIIACGFSCRHQILDAEGVKAVHWVEAVKAD